MNGIANFNDVIEYIESHLSEDLRVEVMARMARLSVYEFRRVFSFVAGISLSEYIRRRRLSVAASELLGGDCSVTDLGLKYGYDTPSSFSRAFKEFHGVSPSAMARGEGSAGMFTKISFDLQLKGGRELRYEITETGPLCLWGYGGRSELRDKECCEDVWEAFYASNLSQISADRIYAAYRNGANWVDCLIGTASETPVPGVERLEIPACRWAVFSLRSTDDGFVNEFYKNILYGWLPSSGFSRAEGVPNLEIYPQDMETEGFEWEIRIPIERI